MSGILMSLLLFKSPVNGKDHDSRSNDSECGSPAIKTPLIDLGVLHYLIRANIRVFRDERSRSRVAWEAQ